MTDNQLIETCLQGRRDCFEPLVRKYQGSVYALALNVLGNGDDAKDAAQETFVQAYVNLDRFDRARNFKTWLLSIAVKRCLDLLRKRKSILGYFLKQTANKRAPGPPAPFKGVEESDIFRPLLKRIKGKERIALLLKMNEGYSAAEIAEVLGCSPVTARVHLFNAKKQLKEHLDAAEKKQLLNRSLRDGPEGAPGEVKHDL